MKKRKSKGNSSVYLELFMVLKMKVKAPTNKIIAMGIASILFATALYIATHAMINIADIITKF